MTTRFRRVGSMAARLAVVAFALFLMLRWFEYKQVYHPTREWGADGSALRVSWEDLTLTTADGVALSAWFFPAPTNSPRRQLAVVVSHGNGGNLSHRLPLYRGLLDTGVNVLAYDYRGYGKSAGRPSEAGTYLDAEAAHAWLVARGFAATNIVAYGESLGGGVATELAGRRPVAGLILHSTFTNIPDIGAELFPFLPVRWLATIHYDNVAKLPRLKVPVLILHSRDDTLIPFRHAERNLAAANEPRQLAEIAGDHNDAWETDARVIVTALDRFLGRLPAAAASAIAPTPPPAR